ncbi:MAG: hypothetical protein N2440_04140, partial [Actinobacteria bacterium]|nr:hypothetical protein [Actinomycetota bacterium]
PSGLQGSCVQIASGGYHSLALRSDGKVYAWGANFAKQRDLTGLNLTNVVMLDGGLSHSVALKADGTVVVFGDTYVNHTYPFEVIEGKNRRVPSVIQGKVIGIACGDNHTLALTSDGYVYGWGDNQYGQAFGPWDADIKNCNHLDSLDTTFTYEFNAPVSIVPDLITFLRHDGQSVPITVKTSGKNLFIKPGAPLNYDYYYTIVFKNGSLKPLEYSLDEMPEFEASYSSWRLFTINGVVYNRTYNWPVTPLIEFFSNVVESSYHLYRDGNLVDWNNGQPVKDKGNYRLEVSARTSSGNESSVTLNFRIDY